MNTPTIRIELAASATAPLRIQTVRLDVTNEGMRHSSTAGFEIEPGEIVQVSLPVGAIVLLSEPRSDSASSSAP